MSGIFHPTGNVLGSMPGSSVRVHCRIVESILVTSRDEVDILNPEIAVQRKSEISANGDMLRERKKTTRGVRPRV